MRSFKVKKIIVPMEKSKADDCEKKLIERFGDRITVHYTNGDVVVESVEESLSDYRIHDEVLEILTGSTHGKNLQSATG